MLIWSFRTVVYLISYNRPVCFSDFVLLFGSRELPVDDTDLLRSDLGFVSGDRLRLVINNDKYVLHSLYSKEKSNNLMGTDFRKFSSKNTLLTSIRLL